MGKRYHWGGESEAGHFDKNGAFRENNLEITDKMSRFVPHLIK